MSLHQVFRVDWTPHAKQRARVTKTGQAYTPPATREAEKRIREAFQGIAPGWQPVEQPISVHIDMTNTYFDLWINETDDWANRKLKGDTDNYAKTVLDALNGVAWVDDKWIRDLRMVKI
jgi:Holliday junction resolvase RusA-like endonuclease